MTSEKTLKEVLTVAIEDETFRSELLKDHHEALKSKGWQLSSDDMKRLDDFMTGKAVGSPEQVLGSFSTSAKGESPWEPPPWSTS